MQTGENSMKEARVYFIILTRVYMLLLYDVMVEYNCSIWTPLFNLAPFQSLTNCKDFSRVL